MGWETLNPTEVKLDAKPAPVVAGTYTLQLTGAFENKYRPADTDIQFTIVDDGENKGRKVYLDLPDPDRLSWSGQVYARLVQALGATVTPYSHPIAELSKVAQNGHSRVTADVYIETFTRKDGTEGSKNRINSKSIRPAA